MVVQGQLLQMIVAQKGPDGGIRLRTEDIPFHRYRFRPDRDAEAAAVPLP